MQELEGIEIGVEMAKLYVYCPRKSTGALELVKALGAIRLRNFDGADFWDKKHRVKIPAGSSIVAWGSKLPELDDVRTLNAQEKIVNKEREVALLTKAGVPTVKFLTPDGKYGPKDYLKAGYLARTSNHMGGTDLLFGTNHPDFYTNKETLTTEVRIHMFAGKSIRAGIKVPRDGFVEGEEKRWKKDTGLYHPWIRSYDGGWRIKYDGFKSNKEMRDLASKAVKALGLTFGAVDIGVKTDGKLIVLEVNSAPGLEGGTIESYVTAIERWWKGAPAEEKE